MVAARAPPEAYTDRAVNPLEVIVDAVPALIAYVDRDQRYGFANRAYETWYGRPRDEIPGQTLRQFLGDDRYEKIRPVVPRAVLQAAT